MNDVVTIRMAACFVRPNAVATGANVDAPEMADFRKYLEEQLVLTTQQVASAKAIWRKYITDIEVQEVGAPPCKEAELEDLLGVYKRQLPAKVFTNSAVVSVLDSMVHALAVAGGEEKERTVVRPSDTLNFGDEIAQSYALNSTGISATLKRIRSVSAREQGVIFRDVVLWMCDHMSSV